MLISYLAQGVKKVGQHCSKRFLLLWNMVLLGCNGETLCIITIVIHRLIFLKHLLMIFLSLGQRRPHLSSVLLLQLVLSCGIVSL